uniref:Uncharacterized protein n=1 Tax=viral metagenome TaxID=1070528 RepID=A0A6M3J5C7_9ZZZZ
MFLEIASGPLGNTWAAAELEVDRVGGAAAAETWTFAANYSGASSVSATGYEVAASIATWLNAGAREWFGTATWGWSVAATGTNGYIGVTYLASGDTWDVTPNASFVDLTGVSAVVGGAGFGPGAWVGSIDCDVELASWGLRHETGPGVVGRGGGYIAGLQNSALTRPRFSAILDEDGCARLWQWLPICSSPRRAYVYQDHMATWQQLASVGRADVVETASAQHWRWAPEVWA